MVSTHRKDAAVSRLDFSEKAMQGTTESKDKRTEMKKERKKEMEIVTKLVLNKF